MVASLGMLQIGVGLDTSTLDKDLKRLESRLTSVSKALGTLGGSQGVDSVVEKLARSATDGATAFKALGDAARSAFSGLDKSSSQGIDAAVKRFEELETKLKDLEARFAKVGTKSPSSGKSTPPPFPGTAPPFPGTAPPNPGSPPVLPSASDIGASVAGYGLIAEASERAFSAVAGYAVGGVKLFQSFEKGLNSFGAVSGASADEISKLSGVALDLAKNTTKTAPEVARAAVELSKLGFSAADTTKELGGLVALSEAAGIGVEEAATIIGVGSNVFQRSANDIANVVSATSAATAANATDMLQAFSKAGGVFKENNQDLETLSVSFGLLRSAGFSAESAGTALKTSMLSLAAPSKVGGEALGKLGISVRDSEGNMRNFIDLIPEFRTALSGVATEDRAQITKDIFGTEAAPAILGLLATNQAKIDEARTKVNDAAAGGVAAQEMAAKLLGGLDGSLTMLSGSLETLQLKAGASLAPLLTTLATSATTVVNAFLGLPAPMQTAAIGFAGAATAAAALVASLAVVNTLDIGGKLVQGAGQAQALFLKASQAVGSFSLGSSSATGSITLFGKASVASMSSFTASSVAALGSMAKLAATAALAVGAAYALSEAWRGLQLGLGNSEEGNAISASNVALSETLEQLKLANGDIGAVTSQLAEMNAEGANLFSAENLQGIFDGIGQSLKEGGPIEVIQDVINQILIIIKEMDAQITGVFAGFLEKINGMIQSAAPLLNLIPGGKAITEGAAGASAGLRAEATRQTAAAAQAKVDANSDLGGGGSLVLTNKQRENQIVVEQTGKLQEKVNQITEQGTKLLLGYSMVQGDATKIGALSSAQKESFVTKSKEQVKAIDQSIAALKNSKPVGEAQTASVKAQIAVLEKSKSTFTDRIAAVEDSTKATLAGTSAVKGASAALNEEEKAMLSKVKADVAGQVASGAISEEEGYAIIMAKEAEFLNARIELNKVKIAELLEIKALASTSPAEAAELDKKIAALGAQNSEMSKEVSKGAKSSAKAKAPSASSASSAPKGISREDAVKESQKKAGEAEAFRQQEEQAKSQILESNATNEVKKALMVGAIDETEAASRIAKIKENSANQQLAMEQGKLSRLRAMSDAGLIDKEKAASEELQITQKLAALELGITEARIASQEAARKKILENIERANKKAEAALSLSLTEETSSIRSQQLGGGLSDTQAEAQIAEAQARQTLGNYDLVMQKITQVQSLKANGTITEKDAESQLLSLEQNRADLNLQRIDNERAARKRAKDEEIAAIDVASARLVGNIQLEQGMIASKLTALNAEQALLSARDGLVKAQEDLGLQRLVERGASEAEIAEFKAGTMEREQAHAVQMMELNIQMQALEAERELRSARIAENEAKIALSKAIALGATQQEIDLLTESLSLRSQNVKEAETAINRQKELGDIQRETLDTQQTGQREAAAHQAKQKSEAAEGEAAAAKDSTKAMAGGGASGGGEGKGRSMNLFGEDIQKDKAASEQISALQKSGATEAEFAKAALGIQGNNEFFLQRLQDMGMGDIVNLANANQTGDLSMEQRNKATFGGENGIGELLAELKNLNGNVSGALKEPKSINISTATPMSDYLAVAGSTNKKRG